MRALIAITLLFCAAVAQAQTKAYVANTAANSVTVIDTVSGTVLGSIPVGTAPTRVAISPDGTRAYVSNRDSASVSAIDTATDSVVATLAVGKSPGALTVSVDGTQVYVMLAGGGIQVLDGVLAAVVATIDVPGTGGSMALSPDGTRAYVASGPVSVIDTATNTVVESFFLPDAGEAIAVAVSPDGKLAYFAATGSDVFGSGGAVVALDTASSAVVGTASLGSLPGQIALTPDGGRAYVGIQGTWVSTGYGAGFLPGRSLAVIDTSTLTAVHRIDLGTQGATAAGIAVTPDRSGVYVSVPRLGVVALIDARTSALKQRTPVAAGPNGLAAIPDPGARLEPYFMDAVDDQPATAFAATGVTAVPNVLGNDRIGGVPATLANVTLSQLSSTDPQIFLDAATGAVHVAPGAVVGVQSVVAYRICERASPLNCAEASVVLKIRERYLIDALDDAATSPAGRTAATRVLANDRLGDVAATLLNVRLTPVSSTHAGIVLNSSGSISVALGVAVGTYSLVYRICELADPLNCDQASAAVTVIPTPIDAVNDTGASTRSGGVALKSVLANDRFGGVAANLTQVTLAALSSTNPGVSLNPANGSVVVASGTPIGVYSLVYRICERASPSNCDEATVSVTVKPYVINAVNDTARVSSTLTGSALASVLGNDTFAGVRATTADVTLSLVSMAPATGLIRLDPADGSLDLLGRLAPGLYLLVYQICEGANPTNCDRATVSLLVSP